MSWSRTMTGGISYYDSTAIVLSVSGSTYTVSNGGSSESFTLTGSNYVPGQGSGSTLVLSGSNYMYTTRDGTVYTLVPTAAGYDEQYRGTYHASSITRPTGEVETLNWETVSNICHWNEKYMFCADHNGERLRSVTSTNGYRIAFTFQVETPDPDGPAPGWAWIASVQAQNMSVSPTSQSWPTLTFSGQTFFTPTITVADSLSRTTTYTFTADGSGYYPTLGHIQRPGATSPNEYIGWNTSSLVSSVNLNGVTDSYAYSTVGTVLTTTVTDPNSNTRVVKVDTTTGLVSSDTNELGKTTSYTYYSPSGLLHTATAPEGNYATYTYDGRGNLIQTTVTPKSGSGLSPVSTYASYPASGTNAWMCASGPAVTCNKPTTATDGNGNVTNYYWDSTSGLPTKTQAPAATTGGIRPETRYTYASIYGQYLSGSSLVNFSTPVTRLSTISQCQTRDNPTNPCGGTSDEVKTTVLYSLSGITNTNALPLKITEAAGDNSVTASTTIAYDTTNYGNVAAVTDPNGNTSQTVYDADREVIGRISPDPDGSGGPLPNPATRITYNNDAQVTKTEVGTAAGGTWSSFSSAYEIDTAYDANARKSADTLKSATTSYALTQYTFDNLGRLQCTATRMNTAIYGSLPSSACVQGTSGSFGPDQITQLSYDAASRPTSTQVSVGTAGANTSATVAYSDNGLPKTLKDGMNNLSTNIYDGFDRVSQTQYPTKSPQGAGTSNSSDYVGYSYDNNSNPTSQHNRDGTSTTVSFDHLNRLTQKVVPTSASGVAGYTTNLSYDLLGRNLTATFASSGLGITNTFDALGRMTSASNNLIGTSQTLSYLYDPGGRRTQLTYPDGHYLNYDYLATNEVLDVRLNGASSGPGIVATYAYDNLGDRSGVTYGGGSIASYGYDSVSRLTGLGLSFSGGTGNLTKTFGYSPSSQISNTTINNDSYAWNAAADVARSHTANGLNQYSNVGGQIYNSDSNGNLISDGTNSFAYDAENHMTSATVGGATTTLSYDPYGRLWKVVNGATDTRYVSDGAHIATVYNASTYYADWMFGPAANEPIAAVTTGAIPSGWLLSDERGSIIARADSSGNNTAIQAYDEYGLPSSTNVTAFQYTGQLYLTQIGMSYFNARMYSQTLGRFMQTDPIGMNGGINFYNYTGNDPVNATDPSGLDYITNPCPTVPDPSSEGGYRVVCTAPSGGIDLSLLPFNLAGGGPWISTGALGGGGSLSSVDLNAVQKSHQYGCALQALGKNALGLGLDALGLVANLAASEYTVPAAVVGAALGAAGIGAGIASPASPWVRAFSVGSAYVGGKSATAVGLSIGGKVAGRLGWAALAASSVIDAAATAKDYAKCESAGK